MAQQEKTCHMSLVPGPYMGREENGFSKSCPLTDVRCTPQHTCPQQIDHVIHTLFFLLEQNWGLLIHIYSCSCLIDFRVINPVGRVPHLYFRYGCVRLYHMAQLSNIVPDLATIFFFTISYCVICVFESFCDSFLIKQ